MPISACVDVCMSRFPLLQYFASFFNSLNSLSMCFSSSSTYATASAVLGNGIDDKRKFLDSMRNLKNVDSALDFFHKMVTINPLPHVKDFTLLFGLIVKMRHYTIAISKIKHLYCLGVKTDVFTLSIVINCLCRLNHTPFGFSVMGIMFKIGLEPTLSTIVNGLCVEGNMTQAASLADHMEKMGYRPNSYTFGEVTKGFCKIGDTSAAIGCLKKMEVRNCIASIVAYNTIIDGLCKDMLVSEALRLCSEMTSKGIHPNLITYSCLIHGLYNSSRWKEAPTLLSEMMQKGIFPDVQSFNILVDAFCKEGLLMGAKVIIGYMAKMGEEPNVFTHSILISGYCLQTQLNTTIPMKSAI